MKLADTNLGRLPDTLQKPLYNRHQIKAGIVHLGLGAFHRAHLALYTENILNRNGGGDGKDWGIIGVSLRSPDIRDKLRPQDNLYTVIEKGVSKDKAYIVGAIKTVLVAPENPEKILSVMSSNDCKIISLTITEKGYCCHPASGSLDIHHPDIIHDLKNLSKPRSALGFLVASLGIRKTKGARIITIVCCDNLSHNGDRLKKLVTEFAGYIDKKLARWIKENIPFPNTVVDRIVPATSAENILELKKNYGYFDQAAVKTEAFSQWIIEDKFASGRPKWEEAGVLLVNDIKPYEGVKIRLLNGCHSAIAYLGYLAGHKYVHQVMAQPDFNKFICTLMHQEIRPTINPPAGLDMRQYCQDLLIRFTNPALHHETYQIGMDGSQKIPQRVLPVLNDQLKRRGKTAGLLLVIAAWMRYTCGIDEQGKVFAVQDPMADKFIRIFEECGLDAEKLSTALLGLTEIFGQVARENKLLQPSICYWLEQLIEQGGAATIKAFSK